MTHKSKTYRVVITFLAFAVALTSFTGCGISSTGGDGTSPQDSAVNIEEAVQTENVVTLSEDATAPDWLSDYPSILEEYRRFAEYQPDSIDDPYDPTYFSVPDGYNMPSMENTLTEAKLISTLDYPEPRDAFGYALKDLNGDGDPELVLLLQDYRILAVFTTAKDKSRLLGAYRARYTCMVLDSGMLCTYGDGGGAYSGYAIWQIPQDGGELLPVEQFGFYGTIGRYKVVDEIKQRISDEEYTGLVHEYIPFAGTVTGDTVQNSRLGFIPLFDESHPTLLNMDDVNRLDCDENVQYVWQYEESTCVVYSVENNGSVIKRLAIFPPSRYIPSLDFHSRRNKIIQFGICGEWLIASVGHYEGSGNAFYGNFVRMKKDGSELEHFWLTDNDTFVIVDDWIYYNYNYRRSWPEKFVGCYRVRPDGTDEQYLGDIIRSIFLYCDDGYVYGSHDTGEAINDFNPIIDLIRCQPDGSDLTTLFSGGTLPMFKDADRIEYRDIVIEDDTVSFTVVVHGNSVGDSRHGHDMYVAVCQVNKDGSNLTLLNEKFNN